jgi:diguanylate cyclase (GGDEF)-like protein/PAS domain S-box-containing protein
VSSRGNQQYIAKLVVLTALCALTAKGGLALAGPVSSISAIWAPTGIALAAIVIWGRRMWPAVLLGALLGDAGTGIPALTVAGIAAGTTLEALTGAWLLSLAGFRPSLPRVRDIVLLAGLAAMLSTVVSATIGVASLWLGGAIDSGQVAMGWLTWWLGDMGGDLLVAPALLVLATHDLRRWLRPRRAVVEAAALALVAFTVSALTVSQQSELVFLTFPVLIWAAVRFRQPGAAVASLIVAGVAITVTARGNGHFLEGSPDDALLLAQLFCSVACTAALVLATITSERERALADLRRSHDELEETVRARTAALTGAHARIAARHELAPVGSWDWDIATDTVTWSDELCAIYGIAIGHPGSTCADYLARVHPDDRSGVLATIERSYANGLPFTLEERIIRPDGTVRSLATGGQVLCDADGRPVRMLGICQDVTESQRADQALLESQERARLIVDAASHAFVSIDESGIVTDWNPAAEELLGWTREEALGRTLADTIVPERDRAPHREALARFVDCGETGNLGLPTELDVLRRDGHLLRVELAISAIKTQDGYIFNAFAQDISERTRAKRLLGTENAVGRALLESAPLAEVRPRVLEEICAGLGWEYGGWWSYDARAGVLHREAAWWAAGVDPTRFERSDDPPTFAPGEGLPGRVWTSGETIVISDPAAEASPTHRPPARTGLSCAIGLAIVSLGEVVGVLECLSAQPLHDGDDTVEMMTRLSERIARYVERERFEGQLQHLADHDPLTDLFNHRRFEEELAREIAAAQRYGTRGAVMALDLDNLKHVNDTLGHDAGNELIARVADLLRTRLRSTDILARVGGDEFAVILPHVDDVQARHIAAELLGAIRELAVVSTPRGSCRTSVSIGITAFADRADKPSGDELLIEADMAMYDAKEAGRDRVHVYDPGTSRQLRRSWAEQIHGALAADRFTLHAQPIVALQGDGRVRHELLVRMISTDGDLIAPAMFLSIAERLNLVQEVDRWVVRHAIALLAERERAGHHDCFDVNLSARSIVDPELPELIKHELDAAGVDPASLTFEVTETVAITDVDRARRFSRALGEMGCGFALDDFGSGFASFSNLKHLPFDEVKIDGEFIDDLATSPVNQLIVRSVVEIARGLGMKTVAECVGDDATIELLRGYGVDFAQGFHIGRPVPMEELSGQPLRSLR